MRGFKIKSQRLPSILNKFLKYALPPGSAYFKMLKHLLSAMMLMAGLFASSAGFCTAFAMLVIMQAAFLGTQPAHFFTNH
jgi:hypothetical protein